MPLTLEQLNAASPAEALSLLDGLYEHSALDCRAGPRRSGPFAAWRT